MSFLTPLSSRTWSGIQRNHFKFHKLSESEIDNLTPVSFPRKRESRETTTNSASLANPELSTSLLCHPGLDPGSRETSTNSVSLANPELPSSHNSPLLSHTFVISTEGRNLKQHISLIPGPCTQLIKNGFNFRIQQFKILGFYGIKFIDGTQNVTGNCS